MAGRIRIYIPADAVPPGHMAVLYGPGAPTVDYTRRERSGRTVVASPGEDAWDAWAGIHNGPRGTGPRGEETRALPLLTRPLVFGVKAFGVKLRERETGAESLAGEVTAFINETPLPPRSMKPAAALVSGAMQYTYSGEVLT